MVKAPRVDHGRIRRETEGRIEYRQNDREVCQTIVIVDRLRPEAPVISVLDLGGPILIDEQSVVQMRFATTILAILRWHLGEDLNR
ncbi:hypothetical protein OG203_45770 [Nocardia sp. NBC_01499]|uniref:hypothetical protein n=1 Tax=Nocardia sp. NBC_01499 TaxID=2903597 RepID=UPI0038648748